MQRLQRRLMVMVFAACLPFLMLGCKGKYDDLNLSMYHFRDTKNLVKFVYDASLILQRDGMKSLAYFQNNRELFKTPDYYLYIYDTKGNNIYHAGMPYIEGQNLWNAVDKQGRKSFQLAVEAAESDDNPHGWVHYSWWEDGKFYPVQKSSCHFKVQTPDGIELIVGGGIDYPHEEKEFIRIVVDAAVRLIADKGPDALADIANPMSQYAFRDVRVFAFYANGEMLISPVITASFSPFNLLDCVDEVKYKPFVNAVEKLHSADAVWEVFMAKNRYKRNLVKKCLYVRKTTMAGDQIYMAAITDLPEPP